MWPVCGKFLVVLIALAVVLGFAYHLVHNLRQARTNYGTPAQTDLPARLR